MKFLIIRFSSIGDIVLTTPVIRCLKQQMKDAEIHFLSKLSMKEVTIANPYIDQFHYYDNNIHEIIEQLKNEKFDYVIDLHKNFRSFRIRIQLGAKVLSYKKLSIQKFLLTRFQINVMPGRHISLRCLDAVKDLGVIDDGKGLDYFIAEKDVVKSERLPLTHSQGFIAIVIGASFYTKKLTQTKLRLLCKNIHYPIILIGGKEDAENGNDIALIDEIKIFNACGKFSLNESADIISKSKLVISHDTGMQYIACAYQKKVFAIWGGTSPKLDVEPYYGKRNISLHKNYLVDKLSCQPCSNYGTTNCPRKHFKCMELQDVEKIATDAIEEIK